MRNLILALLIGMLVGPLASDATDPAIPIVPGTSLGIVPRGGAAGGDALYCNGCDFIGPRNAQGGGPNGQPFDIGAGSAESPSDVAVNWDIGRDFKVYQGHKALRLRCSDRGCGFYFGTQGQERLVAFFGQRVTFYSRPRYARR